MHIPVFGNGDIDTPEKAIAQKNRYGVDGVMIGRAAIGNPWVFNEIKHFMKTGEHRLHQYEERAAAAKNTWFDPRMERRKTWELLK